MVWRKFISLSLLSLGLFTLKIDLSNSVAAETKSKEIELQVGIVQRFGDETTDEITLRSKEGDLLNVTFKDSNDQLQTKEIKDLKLSIEMLPLTEKVVEERIILSDVATFETAENKAKEWKSKGIEVEVTQPQRWQVWAKRDVYSTPILRRWLLESLSTKGFDRPYLESALIAEKPQVFLNINEERYQVSDLKITTEKNRIWVKESESNKLRLYGGKLKIQPNSYGDFTLVNEVPLETYLRGVVPYEIGPNAPQKAMEAQTIIARTYALRNVRRFAADDYQLCASTHCQVYYGLTQTNSRVDRAISATKGLVLTYNSELVDALYFSTSGGITANFSDIWDGEARPYLKPVIDASNPPWNLSQTLEDEANFRRFLTQRNGFNETGRRLFRWSRRSTLEELTEDLQKYLERIKHPLADINEISSLEIVKRSTSGRILQLDVQTDLGIIELHKTEIRSALGPPISTLFYLEPHLDSEEKLVAYTFVGGGFGHGVGLSQFGSYKLAQLGFSAKQILAFYYQGALLQPLDDSIIFWQESN